MIQIRSLCVICVLLGCAAPYVRAEGDEQAEEPDGDYAVNAEGEAIDPHHRFSDDLTSQPARFYVWYDDEGWHLRSAAPANRVRKFTGTITVEGGRFGRMRAVGFERRGRYADSARASNDRRKIEFTIFTSNSFDGFDFTVNGNDATVSFEELKIGEQVYRNRIFIGEEGQHPKERTFSFPSEP